jgi:serine/threonine protein kinase
MDHRPDERTALVPQGASGGSSKPTIVTVDHALPIGTHLAEFEIIALLGAGGFGVVYLVHDEVLQRRVALKEYLPAAFALRDPYGRVCPRTPYDEEAFRIGLRSFVNEARLLAQFEAPSLLKVYRFWESNGTAYMVMPYYRGPTLKQMLAGLVVPVSESMLRRWLDDLLDALEVLHAQQCYHRDISPDNILMVDGERPVLLDFGAARRAIGDITQAFTAIFKQAYAPVEQISNDPNMRQGPWTDLFALASVIHFAIDGKPPPPAIGRLMSDSYVPLVQRYEHRYSKRFLAAIDRALALKAHDRPQSVAEMRTMLGAARPSSRPSSLVTVEETLPARTPGAPGKRRATRLTRHLRMGIAGAACVAAVGLGYRYLTGLADTHGIAHRDTRASTPSVKLPATSTATPTRTPASDPASAFAEVAARASPDRIVDVTNESSRVVIGRDHFAFSIRSTHAGYLYVHMLSNDRRDAQMIFPNAVDRANWIAPGQTLTLPRPAWRMEVAGPAGVDRFVALVSDVPRTFGAAHTVKGEIFSEFTLPSSGPRQGTGLAEALIGAPSCREGKQCSLAFGASTFSIEEVAR